MSNSIKVIKDISTEKMYENQEQTMKTKSSRTNNISEKQDYAISTAMRIARNSRRKGFQHDTIITDSMKRVTDKMAVAKNKIHISPNYAHSFAFANKEGEKTAIELELKDPKTTTRRRKSLKKQLRQVINTIAYAKTMEA
tara:strand:+ start:624 stop:1043 length:420 start_codon:yes stop_codon:yes gene_type:complete